ncbi:hypothetical protein CPC16_003121 [Podila verticillata]|nr:hypothetical protein BGZ52_007704 [Haplosporangium bisporale]KAF9203559.1 hypothetical protein BGZ59_001561 [Podila verticillata]KAF9371340.1 hypothetical protein CPC16_003121 [Podila verticillata]KAI9241065.1 MAG: hypothetical protein BYD32DRAFT_406633 [Podila humilis]KFH74242.1 hypothetical protein MVEG_01455 [Podila verticillata NRRL 6337]
MVKVLVIGAAGYIGIRVIQHLRRADHIVYGASRSASNSSLLSENEAIPVVGTVDDWAQAIKNEHIDTVVDLAGDYDGLKNIVEPILKIAKERESHFGNRLNYIYVSGLWVHGSGTKYINELTPTGTKYSPNQPPNLVAWRPALEREIIKHQDHFNVVILRPSLVYGGTSKIWDLYFSQIYNQIQVSADAPIKLAAKHDGGFSLIHVEDVGSGVAAAVGKAELLAANKDSHVYPIFDLTTSHESIAYIFQRVAQELGHKTGKIEFQPLPEGTDKGSQFTIAFNTSMVHAGITRAQSLLGWTPIKNRGMAADAHIYTKAWLTYYLANQHKK